MANLYATITYDHHAGYSSRTGHNWLGVTAETWSAKIVVSLTKNGHACIRITDKHGNHLITIWEGNIDSFKDKLDTDAERALGKRLDLLATREELTAQANQELIE